jgi:hypothetical protein
MANNHEEESKLVIFFSIELGITTFRGIISDADYTIFFSYTSKFLNEIKIKLFRDGNTVCEEDKDTSEQHEVLNPLIICVIFFYVPNKICPLNKFMDFIIYISTFYLVELNVSTFFLQISIFGLLVRIFFKPLQFCTVFLIICLQICFKFL